jgi:uncharacterized membrane protein HdeD (DUF308 family)
MNLRNEIIRAAIEAGKDIAPELLADAPRKSNPHKWLVTGIILVGCGIAVFMMLWLKHDIAHAMHGLILLLPGAGLLLADYLIKKQTAKQ